MRFYLFLLIFIFSVFISPKKTYSQSIEQQKDSLLKIVRSSKSDSIKIAIYCKIAILYQYTIPDSCKRYGEKILEINKSKPTLLGEGLGNYVLGCASLSYNDLKPTIEYFLIAMNKLERISPPPKSLITLYGLLASVYAELHDFKTGEQYAQKAISLSKKLNSERNLGRAYNNTGDLFEKEGRLKEALSYYEKAYEIAKTQKNAASLSVSSYNVGSIYRRLGNYTLAYPYLMEGLHFSKKEDDKEGLIYSYLELCRVHLHQKGVFQAFPFNDSAIIALSGYKNMFLMKEAYLQRADLFKKVGKYDSAYQYLEMGSLLKDSLYNNIQNKLIFSLTKNQKIQDLEKQRIISQSALSKQIQNNLILMYLGTVLLFALLLLTLIYFQRRKNAKLLQNKNVQIENQKEALSRSNETKDKLISVISHDLRSPLNQMKSLLQLLNHNVISQDDFVKIAQKFQGQIHTLSSNLESVLLWANEQLKGDTINKEQVRIYDVVIQTTQLYEGALNEKKIYVKVDILPNFEMFIDKEHLRVALRNLVGNAIKFSNNNSVIRIFTESNDTEHRLIVSDEGVGMSQEQVAQLFDPTKNISTLGTINESGSGIGLKLSKEFVEKSGGKMVVSSELGKGTQFSIICPLRTQNKYNNQHKE